ncbi:hypothetical protein L596_015408 [Steinernema carpocapsae]|uniref:Uncharacterized protein n=1 Tax=Steinernema carpocapsae TaxID=34508 RepID=A0A4V6A337_STECR|nr:hypothetical protein L596_015408 [Steinernema carpocapsae]
MRPNSENEQLHRIKVDGEQFRTFRRSTMEKVAFGFQASESSRIFALRRDQPSISSISDTPPNTPSSFDGGSSTTSLAISSSDGTLVAACSIADDIRAASRQPGAGAPGVGTDNFWIGQRLAGKQTSNRPMIKRYWEDNIRKEETEKARQAAAAGQKKTYGFPRWRSNDAMSASLVASAKSTEMIPKDSRIPQHRRKKMEQTEREAEVEKHQIKLDAEPPKQIPKGKSLDSINLQMHLDHRPWYDRGQIRQAISRESIANTTATKSKFERGASPGPLGPQQHQDRRPDPQQLHRRPQQLQNGWSHEVPMAHPISKQPARQLFSPPQNGSHNGESSSCHESAPSEEFLEYALDTDQFLFLQMLRQNMHMVQDFGIILPAKVKNLINELHPVSVEIRQIVEVASILSPCSRSHTPNQTSGRYVKSHTSSTTNHPKFRRLYDMSMKDLPENKRQSLQELDQIRSGESLIAAEIRNFKEREDELKRSRSELGLPNLEDTFQQWRHGYDKRPMSQNSLQSAVSYDQLHQVVAQNGDRFAKAGSMDHLEESSLNYTQNAVSSQNRLQRYRLHRSEDPDVMIYGPSTNQQRMNTDSAIRIVTSPTYNNHHD